MDKTVAGTPWPAEENQATVSQYFNLFLDDLQNAPINKRASYRSLSERFGRSMSAYELKMCNISAILVRLGWPHLRGLLPRSNYQSSLEITVAEYISTINSQDLRVFDTIEPAESIHKTFDLNLRPVPTLLKGDLIEAEHTTVIAARRDFVAREAANSALGLAGELAVIDHEIKRLESLGLSHLASRVEHISQTQGDGTGYDILSFDTDGKERLVEVKTSRYGAGTPFYITKNEISVADQHLDQYHLYRLYDFREINGTGSFYKLHGNIRQRVDLTPTLYQATPA